MSNKAINWARSQRIATRPGDRHILLLMADRAGDDGDGSFPSIGTLAEESGYSERTVQRIVQNLIHVGAIEPGNAKLAEVRIQRADRRPNVYRLRVDILTLPPTKKRSRNGVTSVQNGVTSATKRRGDIRARGDICDMNGVTSVQNGVTSATERGDKGVTRTLLEPNIEPNIEPNTPGGAAPAAPETELQAACRATWKAYGEAYAERYGAKPVRNASVNAKVKQFVQRIGYDESPAVARFYVERVVESFVLRKVHDVGLLLSGAEGYRTQWVAGRGAVVPNRQEALEERNRSVGAEWAAQKRAQLEASHA